MKIVERTTNHIQQVVSAFCRIGIEKGLSRGMAFYKSQQQFFWDTQLPLVEMTRWDFLKKDKVATENLSLIPFVILNRSVSLQLELH